MATYNDIFSLFKAIANSIRTKKGTNALINAQNFPSEINSILAPSGAKSITSNGSHDVKAYATANVNVPAPTLNVKTGYHHRQYVSGPTTVLDLGSARTVKAYAVGGSSWNGGYARIQYSSNNSSWTTFDSVYYSPQKNQGDAVASKGGACSISARYWRVLTGEGDSNGSDGWIAVAYI